LIVFPHCKINLGLSITDKRNDGYHNLETVFYPLPVRDVLEIITDKNSSSITTNQAHGEVKLLTSGIKVNGNSMDNLCIKAYYLLQRDFPELPSIQMHLHKAIPMGAGLGGGSADGAFTLQLLNTQFKLDLSPARLMNYALQLGSDCPFFIADTPCFAVGRGEILEPVALNLSGYLFVLINPGIVINTGWAFAQLNIDTDRLAERVESLKDSIMRPVSEWKNFITNDFEKPVFEKYHEINLIKSKLYEQGALYASMTGSGSTVYGIFDKGATPDCNFPDNYWVTKLNV